MHNCRVGMKHARSITDAKTAGAYDRSHDRKANLSAVRVPSEQHVRAKVGELGECCEIRCVGDAEAQAGLGADRAYVGKRIHHVIKSVVPVVRIVAPQGAYDYQNKYFTDVTQYHCPSGLPASEEAEIQRWVLEAYRVLGCRGWGRADLMIRACDRKPFLLEMNTSPGMTSHSLVPISAKAAGIGYQELCVRLVADASLDHPHGGGA